MQWGHPRFRDLLDVVRRSSGAEPSWIRTDRVHEQHEGETVWIGDVEVFALAGHPQANVAYAWSYETDDGKRRTVTVLGIPPIDTATDAVRAAIASGQQR